MAPRATGLAPDTPPDVALRQIVADCHADLLKYRLVALQSRRPIGIHQTRVALRRLRAAFGLFKSAVDGPVVRGLAAEAKWLAGECGPARDLYVFLNESVEAVPPIVKRVANRLAATHLERARTALSGARFESFRRQLEAFMALPGADSGCRLDEFARAVLDERYDKVMRRGRRLASLDSERLHRLRIAIKKLRYAAGFMRPAFASSQVKPYIEATAHLQNALGAMNDGAVAAHMLADLAMAARPTEELRPALKELSAQVKGGNKRRWRKVEEAWAEFVAVPCFWRPQPGRIEPGASMKESSE
ncbi:MAG: CHAD domain-containing protein [Alphaproteobacteria bacterium]|nr:CHAD domain-containing protein [Alphaproteobacteria bacterium]MBV8410917.1 CHAD domain-containing protein [Alphaproteobacteria bacterium]